MQIITTPKTLLLTLMACGLSGAACAGDQAKHNSADHNPDVSFIKADSNEDNHLSREEFKVFSALQAEAGDVDYSAINAAGTEDLHFSGKDIDGDGLLTQDELAYKVILNDEPAEIKSSYGSSNQAGGAVDAPDSSDNEPSPEGDPVQELEPSEE